MKAIVRGVVWLLVGAVWCWGMAALSLFPGWPIGVRWAVGSGWVGWAVLVFWRLRSPWRQTVLLAGAVLVWAGWSMIKPAIERDWLPDVARQATASFDGDFVTVHNVRNATYRSATGYDVTWEERRYNLRQLVRIDFMVEPFSEWRGLAHTLVTFGFADGEHVAISVETRKERGEHYSPFRGLLRHYELIYVVGDERDLIGLRANIRRDRVYLYPIRTTPDKARAMFMSMLQRANKLAVEPEFYDSIFSTCTSNIRRHAATLRADGLAPDWRTVFPGYADELAWQLGLIDFQGTLAQARQQFQINARSAFDAANGKTWSAQIRALPKLSEADASSTRASRAAGRT